MNEVVNIIIPKKSLIQIDLQDFEESFQTIQKVISTEEEYEFRLAAITKVRKNVMNEYSLLAILDRIITREGVQSPDISPHKLYERKQMREKFPSDIVVHIA